ncbi:MULTISPECIES: initiation control protein YabA [Enterococcaceae]|uniref:initiation-control protein YabA n=1 Tax=Enterococcaceae TaxID=81852 RepID=UPI000E4EC0BA|nr:MULTISPECIES: initiation control protein YabA [Enterococcaceae]MCI0130069.1 initiation control protein YabA [Vagococcus sp. CY53-2]RGI30928.1 DNA replication initiation control protein YabA [Melissococcus sp. OM08-11BH]UNM88890.1 initiation control protein YabA [Vagococcus sp. CY52-2]
MDKMKLYDELVNVERQLETMLFQVKEMKPIVDNLVEENLNLKLENQHLHDKLDKLEKQEIVDDGRQELSKSRLNLEKLYEQGFHVCKDFYGSRRENQEECVFCSSMIYGK